MNQKYISNSERGGANARLIIVLAALLLAVNAGVNYVPVAYEAESFKSEMYTAVVQGLATPGRGISPVDAVKQRIKRAAIANSVPSDARIDIKQVNQIVTAHVVYSKPVSIIPFGIYTYNYRFDHTATPTGFLLKE